MRVEVLVLDVRACLLVVTDERSNPELKLGAEVSITFAAKSSSLSAKLFEGILVRHRIEVRHGISNLVLEAKAWAVKMTIGEKNAYFKEKKDSEIIKALIGKADDFFAMLAKEKGTCG